MLRFLSIFLALILSATGYPQPVAAKWYKGNTHTHTSNSDGDSTPDEVVKWYRDAYYNFLFMTDHEHITAVDPLNTQFGKAGEFVVFSGQEVTDRFGGKPYHVNGLGLRKVVMPSRGEGVTMNYQKNIDAIRAAGGVPQLNHPNFGWAATSEDIMQLKNVFLLEIFNGHPLVNNFGGGGSPSVEAMWDAVLSSGMVMYGIAVDDVHSVKRLGDRAVPTPGHGWIMVRSNELTQAAILAALERGDFYASTGVELEDFVSNERSITVKIKQQRWSKYRVAFIGKGGRVLSETFANPAVYKIEGNEGYIRAKVYESNGKLAWTQPVFIKK